MITLSFNPLQFVVNILQSCGSLFYNVWNSLNAWELLLTMVIAFLSFRMIIAPLFGVRLSVGSDKVVKHSDQDDARSFWREVDRGDL